VPYLHKEDFKTVDTTVASKKETNEGRGEGKEDRRRVKGREKIFSCFVDRR
jgi:hypothetical protein